MMKARVKYTLFSLTFDLNIDVNIEIFNATHHLFRFMKGINKRAD